VYVFNEKFRAAIRAIDEVERFYPGEKETLEENPKSNIILFPEHYTMQEGSKLPKSSLEPEYKGKR
jgi:hypothetical protein